MSDSWIQQLSASPVIGIIRDPNPDQAQLQAKSALLSGIHHLEITGTVPHYLELIQQLRQTHPDACIGAGTILDRQTAEAAIAAGAQFLVSPILNPTVIEVARDRQIPMVPGALTPNEIWQALQMKVSAIKVFPIESLGGSTLLKHLNKPLGPLPLIPTGGVTIGNSFEFLTAGALAIGLGGDLFPLDLCQQHQWDFIQMRLQTFMQAIHRWSQEHR